MARRTELTDEEMEKIVTYLREGKNRYSLLVSYNIGWARLLKICKEYNIPPASRYKKFNQFIEKK